MSTRLRATLLFLILSIANTGVAQELDDLFDDSDESPPCECDHRIYHWKDFPDWMPESARSALMHAVSGHPKTIARDLLYCPTTNAVIERVPLKATYSFLVCPYDWQGFKPRFTTEKSLREHGIPVDKIRAMFQLPSVVMGPLEILVRAHHSGDMMGSPEVIREP